MRNDIIEKFSKTFFVKYGEHNKNKEEAQKERLERENLLKQMTNEEIDYIISKSTNTSAKIYLSKFKKKE